MFGKLPDLELKTYLTQWYMMLPCSLSSQHPYKKELHLLEVSGIPMRRLFVTAKRDQRIPLGHHKAMLT